MLKVCQETSNILKGCSGENCNQLNNSTYKFPQICPFSYRDIFRVWRYKFIRLLLTVKASHRRPECSVASREPKIRSGSKHMGFQFDENSKHTPAWLPVFSSSGKSHQQFDASWGYCYNSQYKKIIGMKLRWQFEIFRFKKLFSPVFRKFFGSLKTFPAVSIAKCNAISITQYTTTIIA